MPMVVVLPVPFTPTTRITSGSPSTETTGCFALAWFNTAFSRKGTAVEPWKPTTAIVTTGPYRLTRNPAYLGMALTYVGIALMSDALWVLLPLPVVLAVIDRAVIAREERYLERKFGDEYLDFKRRRRRWV